MIFTYFVKSYFHLTKVLKSKPRRMQYLNPYPNRDINTHVIEKYTGEIFKDLALARRTVFLQIATVYNTLVLEIKSKFSVNVFLRVSDLLNLSLVRVSIISYYVVQIIYLKRALSSLR